MRRLSRAQPGMRAEPEGSEVFAFGKSEVATSEVASNLAVKFLFTTKVVEELKWHTGQGAEYEKSDMCIAVSNQIEPGFDGEKSLKCAGFPLAIRRYSCTSILSFKKFCARENCEHLKIGILRWIWAVATAAVSTYCKGASVLRREK